MYKRFVSFFIAVTMVLGLFGFIAHADAGTFSVSVASQQADAPLTRNFVDFTVVGIPAGVEQLIISTNRLEPWPMPYVSEVVPVPTGATTVSGQINVLERWPITAHYLNPIGTVDADGNPEYDANWFELTARDFTGDVAGAAIAIPRRIGPPAGVTFTATFDPNNGAFTAGPNPTDDRVISNLASGATILATDVAVTHLYHEFLGWVTGTPPTRIAAGDPITITATATFIAQWRTIPAPVLSGPSSVVQGRTSAAFSALSTPVLNPPAPPAPTPALATATHDYVATATIDGTAVTATRGGGAVSGINFHTNGTITVDYGVPVGTVIAVTATRTNHLALSSAANLSSNVVNLTVAAPPPVVAIPPGAPQPRPRPGDIVGPLDTERVERVDDPAPELVHEDEPRWPTTRTPAFMIFNDVPLAEWYHDFITIVAHYNHMRGIDTLSRPTFAPDMLMDRAMFAQVLANRSGAALPTGGTNAFNDISGHWGAPAINWAYAQGLVYGVGGGLFAPDDPITREQMAAMISRYVRTRNISLPTRSVSPFGDAATISPWATGYVASIQDLGLIIGEAGNFHPHRTSMRSEAATIFARITRYSTNCPVCISLIG